MKTLLIPTLIALLAACGGGDGAGATAGATESTLPETFWAAEAGAEAVDVFALRDGVKSGDAVVVKGTVKDFVADVAAFRLVEDTLRSCNEIPGDACPTPWDYCCADRDELMRGTAIVEFQEDGALGSWSVQGFHGMDHLSEVVVAGTVSFDEANNMTIVADSIRLQ